MGGAIYQRVRTAIGQPVSPPSLGADQARTEIEKLRNLEYWKWGMKPELEDGSADLNTSPQNKVTMISNRHPGMLPA